MIPDFENVVFETVAAEAEALASGGCIRNGSQCLHIALSIMREESADEEWCASLAARYEQALAAYVRRHEVGFFPASSAA